MELFAIANISDGKNTIGLRILDVNNKKVNNLPMKNIKDILERNISISNIQISNHKIIGSNGNIDRLPTLVNEKLVGKSSLIILAQIGDIGYVVSDFKGQILKLRNEDVIKYAKTEGIANGKLVRKGDKEFISAINGQYNLLEHKEKSLDAINGCALYTGEKIDSIKPLKSILVSQFTGMDKIKFSNAHNIFPYYVIELNGNSISCDVDHDRLLKSTKSDIKKDLLFHNDEYTLLGTLARFLDINDTNFEQDIRDIIKLQRFREWIEGSIKNSALKNYNDSVQKEDLDLILELPYLNHCVQVCKENINSNDNMYDNITGEKINEYMGYLKRINQPIVVYTTFSNGNTALARECSESGVNYKILIDTSEKYIKDRIKTIELEKIYENHKLYSNVVVEDRDITITGLDGAYKYNMDKIYDIYKRKTVKSTKSIKAKLLGVDYSESITHKFELKNLRTDEEIVIIPPNVRHIMKNSILLNDKNKVLVFGENIESYKHNCISFEGKRNLETVVIRSNKEVAIGIIQEFTVLDLKTPKIKIDRPIKADDFVELSLITNKLDIECTKFDDKFIGQVMDSFCDRLKVLDGSSGLPMRLRLVEKSKLADLVITFYKAVKMWDTVNSNTSEKLKNNVNNKLSRRKQFVKVLENDKRLARYIDWRLKNV